MFLPVLVRDLKFLQSGLGVSVDAVIGLDVLGQRSFTIDYKKTKIIFGPVRPLDFEIPFQSEPPFVTVQIDAEGRHIQVLLDTGASGLLLFRSRVNDRFPNLTSLGEKTSSNMGGTFRLERLLFARVRLGGMDFVQQKAFVVDDQEDGGGDFDGLLGVSILGLTQIAFDFQRHVFSGKR